MNQWTSDDFGRQASLSDGCATARNSDSFGDNHRSELTSALLYTNSYDCILASVGNGNITECIDASGTVRAHHFRDAGL
jgi:hypothetical protein